MARELPVEQLIDSVADGADIDWEQVERATRGEQERHLVEDLRLVAGIAQLHRALARSGEHDTGPPIERPVWGDLQLIAPLGKGAFGEVYLARDTRLDRLVALKLLRQEIASQPSLAAQLLEEARILARVRHSNVVLVHGAGVHDGRAGFWMEYIAGDTLEDRLSREGPLSADEAASVAREVCRALAAVHAAGLIHRDVKARNIMRERGGRLVLMDFGAGITAARARHGHSPRIGTPMYLAPETLAGAPASVESDLYAVGVLVYHLVTARFPYDAKDVDELREAQSRSSYTPLRDVRPEVPTPLVQVVDRALAPVEQRYRSAGEMAAALDRVVSDRPRFDVRRRAIAVSLLAVVAMVLLALVIAGRIFPPPAPASAIDVIAVMPFTNQTGEADLDAIAGGLARDVERHLQRLDVQVRGPGQAGASAPIFEAAVFARQTAADAVLTAGLRRAGPDRFGLAVRVLASPSDAQIFQHTYEADRAELPWLGHRVALDVAREAGVKPPPGPWKPAAPYPAYEAYQRGRTYAELRNQQSLLRSIEYYKDAIRLAPDYAEPWAGLADSYIALGVPTFGSLSPMDSRRLAREAATNALQRDPDSVEAHTSLAFLAYFHDWDWAAAEARFKQAIDLNPQYALAHGWYGDYLNAMGRHDEALAAIGRAREIDPRSLLFHRDVAWHYFFQRRYDEAIDHLHETLRMDPGYAPARSLLGRALIAAGRYDEGLQELRRVAPELPRGTALTFEAWAEAAAGARADAERHLAEAIRLARHEHVAPYYIALVYTALDRPEDAVKWLQRGYETQDTTMVNVKADPRFDPLRPHPGYQQVLRQMRFPEP